jgi:uncharacterized membrane protein
MPPLSAVIAAVASFAALDIAWVGYVARSFYAQMAGQYLAASARLAPAFLFYIIYGSAIAYFAVRPALAAGSVWLAVLNGALLGLTGYGLYNLTNRALFEVWPLKLVVVDIAWGVDITAAVAAIAYLVATSFGR